MRPVVCCVDFIVFGLLSLEQQVPRRQCHRFPASVPRK
jgi:hypothetical protein